jgi:hypothetical protein
MTEPRIPEERRLSAAAMERRRAHLVAEIENAPARRFQHAGVTLRRLPVLATAAVVLVALAISGTLAVVDRHAETDHEAKLLLASTTTAVDNAVDVVLYAKETHFRKDDRMQPERVLEGWSDRRTTGVGRVREVDEAGSPVIDSASKLDEKGTPVRQDVVYDTSTVHVSPGQSVSLKPLLPDGMATVIGEENINGTDAIRVRGTHNGVEVESWIDDTTKLPVRAASKDESGIVVLDYQWLPRTAETLASLVQTVPAEFTVTNAPVNKALLPDAPGSPLAPVSPPSSDPDDQHDGTAKDAGTIPSLRPPLTTTPTTWRSTPTTQATNTTAVTNPPGTNAPGTTPPTTEVPRTTPTTSAPVLQAKTGEPDRIGSRACYISTLSNTQQIRTCISAGDSSAGATTEAMKFVDGQWVHDNSVLVSVDQVMFYVDGTMVGGAAYPSGPQAASAYGSTRGNPSIDRSSDHKVSAMATVGLWVNGEEVSRVTLESRQGTLTAQP